MNGVTPVFAAIMCMVGICVVVLLAIIVECFFMGPWSRTPYDDL